MARILIVDDQDRTAKLCRKALPEHEYTGPARSWSDAEASIRQSRPELVLLDVHFDIDPGALLGLPEDADERRLERTRREQGIHILDSLRKRWPDLPVILMTARADLPLERAAERLDAEEYTYFLDDDGVDAATLKNQIGGILQARRGREREGPVYWGRTVKMQRIRQRLHTLSKGRLPVILAGPTGTGKSLVARHVLHRRSERRGRFVALDLSTIPRDLVGAQLFGSVKGAYTGSIGDRPGAFEEAQGGTLFLDEIGNLSEPTQKMLLTALQEGVVTRIGESREREIDVKLVVASHEDLGAMVREGRFRQDLYMRLNPACTVALPPLRERDIPMEGLAEFFLQRALGTATVSDLVRSHRQVHAVPGETVRVVIGDHVPAGEEGVLHVLLPARSLGLLREHPWPGNLRELSMVMENALVFALAESGPVGGRGDVLQCRPKLLRDLLLQTRGLATGGAQEGFGLTVHLQASDTLNRVAADVEQQYFRALFLKYEGDFRQMAQVLMGDPECARKVQLRFNQLGLKVREMKRRMG